MSPCKVSLKTCKIRLLCLKCIGNYVIFQMNKILTSERFRPDFYIDLLTSASIGHDVCKLKHKLVALQFIYQHMQYSNVNMQGHYANMRFYQKLKDNSLDVNLSTCKIIMLKSC